MTVASDRATIAKVFIGLTISSQEKVNPFQGKMAEIVFCAGRGQTITMM